MFDVVIHDFPHLNFSLEALTHQQARERAEDEVKRRIMEATEVNPAEREAKEVAAKQGDVEKQAAGDREEKTEKSPKP
jgi:uncharacterized protein YggL (DUF469 family)